MCESKLLGLKGCNATPPATGLYIDDLGISQSLLGQFITDSYQNGVELFEAKRSLAWKSLQSKMMNAMASHLKANTLIEGRRVGIINTQPATAQTALGAGNWVGVLLKVNPNRDSFLQLSLTQLLIYGASQDTPIKIFDTTTRKQIGSLKLADGDIDETIYQVLKAARRTAEIAIVYQSTFDTFKTIPKYGSCLDCGGNPKYSHMCPHVDALGVKLTISGDTIQTQSSTPYTWGMSLLYSLSCDREAWLCSIGANLSMALAYATAVEIYDYALTQSPSQRVNTAVTINRGQKPFATANAVEGIVAARDIAAQRFNEELNAVLQNMKLPMDSACFECRRGTMLVTAIP